MQGASYVFETGAGGLPRLQLVAPDGGRAQAYLQGAHLTSWQPPGFGERMYLSKSTVYEAGGLIRGGVPVCFPQFGVLGPLPMHGFVRRMPWQFDGIEHTPAGGLAALLSLRDTLQTQAAWPHSFQCNLRLQIEGPTLDIELEVLNTGESEFTFTGALHTYFGVTFIEGTSVAGLQGCSYLDGGPQGSLKQQGDTFLMAPSSLSRIYLGVPGPLRLDDGVHNLLITMRGFSDVVVWNPGTGRPAALSDIGPQDDQHFVCVEAARVERPVSLQPGEHWVGGQSVQVESRLS